ATDIPSPKDDGKTGGNASAGQGEQAQSQGTVQRLNSGTGFRVNQVCTNCNAASLSVNGLTGDHVLVTWDGMPMSGGLSTVYHLTQIPSQLVGHTEIIRGPGSVL